MPLNVGAGRREISIHVPREGHDRLFCLRKTQLFKISIHVPREGHDAKIYLFADCGGIAFQSTCPARGTTKMQWIHKAQPAHFNPRAPRGARQGSIIDLKARPRDNFNPRAPRGARLNGIHTKTGNHYFNPRAPRGARPSPPIPGRRDIRDFNPRAPRGARLRYRLRIPARQPYFNPRAPRGARLSRAIDSAEAKSISIHVPREGHDLVAKNTLSRCRRFQSTCPARGTTPLTRVVYPCPAFQSTCPARGTTCHNAQQRPRNAYFNPRAPRGARLSISAYSSRVGSFQSTCPARGTTILSYTITIWRRTFQSTCPARGTTTL